jgi:hypothetical protein
MTPSPAARAPTAGHPALHSQRQAERDRCVRSPPLPPSTPAGAHRRASRAGAGPQLRECSSTHEYAPLSLTRLTESPKRSRDGIDSRQGRGVVADRRLVWAARKIVDPIPLPPRRPREQRRIRASRGQRRRKRRWAVTRVLAQFTTHVRQRPRQDSNLRTRLRRPMLYPLSYEGGRRQGSAPAAGGRTRFGAGHARR